MWANSIESWFFEPPRETKISLKFRIVQEIEGKITFGLCYTREVRKIEGSRNWIPMIKEQIHCRFKKSDKAKLKAIQNSFGFLLVRCLQTQVTIWTNRSASRVVHVSRFTALSQITRIASYERSHWLVVFFSVFYIFLAIVTVIALEWKNYY